MTHFRAAEMCMKPSPWREAGVAVAGLLVPSGGAVLTRGGGAELLAHALASRLSFFCGVVTLMKALGQATDQSLLTPEVLAAETRRMLADERAEALVDGFGAHWMGLPELDAATPTRQAFPPSMRSCAVRWRWAPRPDASCDHG